MSPEFLWPGLGTIALGVVCAYLCWIARKNDRYVTRTLDGLIRAGRYAEGDRARLARAGGLVLAFGMAVGCVLVLTGIATLVVGLVE